MIKINHVRSQCVFQLLRQVSLHIPEIICYIWYMSVFNVRIEARFIHSRSDITNLKEFAESTHA